MFKKLEEDRKTALAAEESPESECACPCGQSATAGDEPQPEANTLSVHLPENYRING
jgi:hypothetical protein